MHQMSLDFDRPRAPDLARPEIRLATLFSSQVAREGRGVRRSLRDIRRFAGWEAFVAGIERRGYRAFVNSGEVVIFCNRAPIASVGRP